LGWVDAAPEPV